MKEIIYKIINIFTFGKGLSKTFHGYKLRLPTRYLNYFSSDYETSNFLFIKNNIKKGDVILDIGAHLGLFACYAAKVINSEGKIYAFEPAPSTNALLQKTISINKMNNVIEGRSEAMGLKSGKCVFYVSRLKGDNTNSLVEYVSDRNLTGIEVPVSTIDDFVKSKELKQVNFIKIDVEGAEFDTLRGGENTFKNLRPTCILAIHPIPIRKKGDTLEDIYDFIVRCNYTILSDNKILSKESFCETTDLLDLHLLPT